MEEKKPDVIQVEYNDKKKVIYVNKDKQTVLWTVYPVSYTHLTLPTKA